MSEKLAFLAHRAQHAAWQAAGAPGCPATGDFVLLDGFIASRKRHVDLWAYLPEQEIARHDAMAWEFCRTLGEHLTGVIRWKQADFGQLCRFDSFWSVRALLNTHQAALGAARAEAWDGVVHFGEMEAADHFDLPDRPADLFNAAAACAARTCGIPSEILRLPSTTSAEGLFHPHFVAGMKLAAKPPWPVRPDVVCVAEGLGLDEQARLLLGGNEAGESVWSAVTGADVDAAIPSTSLRLLRWMPWDMQGVREAAKVLHEVPKWIRSGELRGPSCLAEPEYAFVWRRMADWIVQGATEHRLTRLLARGWRPRVAIMGSDIFGPGRCAAQGWLDEGTEVIAIDHVGLGWSSSNRWHEGTKTHLAAWGEVDARGRLPQKPAGVHVAPIGSLRSDFEQDMASGPLDRADGHIAIFTSETSSGLRMHGWSPPAALRAAWDALMTGAAQARVNLVIKPHPRYDHPDFYERLCATKCPQASFERGQAGDALRGASASILVNTPSTVLVQSIAAGVPVLYLRKGVAAFSDPPLPPEIIPAPDGADALAAVLIRLRDDAAFRAEMRAAQRNWLSTVLSATGMEAAARMRALVSDLTKAKPAAETAPSARWLLAVFTAIDDFRRLVLSESAFTLRMRELGREAADVHALAEEGLLVDRLPEYFLRVIVWADWPEGSTRRRLAALRGLRAVLPHPLRPGWKSLLGPARTILEQARSQRDRSAAAKEQK